MHRSRIRSGSYLKTKDAFDPENFYADAVSPGSRKHGVLLVDGREYASTLQCRHCGGHFVHRKDRGDWICLKCNGVVCGKKDCVIECIPFEKKLDLFEKCAT